MIWNDGERPKNLWHHFQDRGNHGEKHRGQVILERPGQEKEHGGKFLTLGRSSGL